MLRWLKVLLVLVLMLPVGAPVWAQPYPPPPVPGDVAPAWAPAPGAPKVMYAPNVPGDVFRVGRHQYYYYYGGNWYRGKSPLGPWHPARKVPKSLYRLSGSAFKGAPPW